MLTNVLSISKEEFGREWVNKFPPSFLERITQKMIQTAPQVLIPSASRLRVTDPT
jgi:hypothetical protein